MAHGSATAAAGARQDGQADLERRLPPSPVGEGRPARGDGVGELAQLGPLTEDLKKYGKSYESYVYPGARHAFNNDARPARYDEAAAKLAWKRTVAHFKKNLGG